jgi:hypothetical protein
VADLFVFSRSRAACSRVFIASAWPALSASRRRRSSKREYSSLAAIGLLPTHRAGVRQDRTLVEAEKIVQSCFPIVQKDLPAPSRLVLGEVEEHHHDPIELRDLGFAQVILRDRDIAFTDDVALPGGEAHVRPPGDQLRSRLSRDGKCSLFCAIWKKRLRFHGFRIVVGCERQDLSHAHIHSSLAGRECRGCAPAAHRSDRARPVRAGSSGARRRARIL